MLGGDGLHGLSTQRNRRHTRTRLTHTHHPRRNSALRHFLRSLFDVLCARGPSPRWEVSRKPVASDQRGSKMPHHQVGAPRAGRTLIGCFIHVQQHWELIKLSKHAGDGTLVHIVHHREAHFGHACLRSVGPCTFLTDPHLRNCAEVHIACRPPSRPK